MLQEVDKVCNLSYFNNEHSSATKHNSQMLSILVLLSVLRISDVINWSGAGALLNDTFSTRLDSSVRMTMSQKPNCPFTL